MGQWFSSLLSQVIAGQVRTALAVGGGVLLANGADPAAVSNLQSCLAEPVVGLGMWAIAGLWSAKAKVAASQPTAQPVEVAEPQFPVIKYPK